MVDFNKEEENFKAALRRFEEESKKIRAGRAAPAVLENILVESYGGAEERVLLPIKNIAAISIANARSLIIKPWDRNIMPAIESALGKAGISAVIVAEKDQIRVTFPPLTEERRRDLIKLTKKFAEEAKIQVRLMRDEIWKSIQEQAKLKRISEDQKFSQKEKMEKIVGEYNSKIAELTKKKEEELMIM